MGQRWRKFHCQQRPRRHITHHTIITHHNHAQTLDKCPASHHYTINNIVQTPSYSPQRFYLYAMPTLSGLPDCKHGCSDKSTCLHQCCKRNLRPQLDDSEAIALVPQVQGAPSQIGAAGARGSRSQLPDREVATRNTPALRQESPSAQGIPLGAPANSTVPASSVGTPGRRTPSSTPPLGPHPPAPLCPSAARNGLLLCVYRCQSS